MIDPRSRVPPGDPVRAPLAGRSIAVVAAVLLGCAQAAPAPAAPPSAGGQAADTVELTGYLSRKGPSETSWWAVTDRAGNVYQLVDVTPELEARFRGLQNAQVTLRVERLRKLLHEEVRVREVLRPAPGG